MELRFKWLLVGIMVSSMSLASQKGWLIRCAKSGPPLAQLKEQMKRGKINVLASFERNDESVQKYCGDGERLQAFHLWKFQSERAKNLVRGLTDPPEGFDPKPPKRIH